MFRRVSARRRHFFGAGVVAVGWAALRGVERAVVGGGSSNGAETGANIEFDIWYRRDSAAFRRVIGGRSYMVRRVLRRRIERARAEGRRSKWGRARAEKSFDNYRYFDRYSIKMGLDVTNTFVNIDISKYRYRYIEVPGLLKVVPHLLVQFVAKGGAGTKFFGFGQRFGQLSAFRPRWNRRPARGAPNGPGPVEFGPAQRELAGRKRGTRNRKPP
jgi:hypothetical protein